MSIIAWIILGLVAGFIGNQIVKGRSAGIVGNVLVGVIGALAGGFLFEMIGGTGVTGFNLWSLFVAVIGSVVLLIAYNAIRRTTAR